MAAKIGTLDDCSVSNYVERVEMYFEVAADSRR